MEQNKEKAAEAAPEGIYVHIKVDTAQFEQELRRIAETIPRRVYKEFPCMSA